MSAGQGLPEAAVAQDARKSPGGSLHLHEGVTDTFLRTVRVCGANVVCSSEIQCVGVTQVYQGHTLEKTYLGEDFFWAITPTAGDFILFKFDRPVYIER